ncbi:50S ribosomal protein L18Ae [Candidatus Marsarchaeota archaeon]|jgi:ribosomal protein L20A (L18A)|nr:50S ribosomal protein L18Ae [Candidatus Marsarchaeota archaeon]
MGEKGQFSIKGRIKGERRFSLNVAAMSESDARRVAMILLGSRHKLKKTAIEIEEVKRE